ncbi:Tetratricopeptide repeat protein, partial [Schistosoma japonicum]
IHLYMSNLKAAEQTLETGVGNNFEVRNHPLYQLVQARLMIEQGSTKIAIQILKQTIANLSQSLKSNNFNYSFSELTPFDKLSLYIELADAHRTLGEQHEAKKVLQDAYLTFAGTVEVARVTIAMANLALSQNDYETALNTLRQIELDHPYYITARQHMADIYLHHRKKKKLYIACYRELTENLGTNETYLLLGEAYMTIQEPEHAIEIYESILRKNPNDLRLASKIGHALVKIHHYAKAVSYYETAVKTGQNGLRLDLADLLINIKQFKKAKRLLHSMLTDEIIESASDVNELQELCNALKLLVKLQTLEDDKLTERINTLNNLKSIQTRLLKRIQTTEVKDVVNEQKINLSETLLQLASTCMLDIQAQCGDYFNINRFPKDGYTESTTATTIDPNNNLSQNLTSIVNYCEDAIKHASTISGLEISSTLQQNKTNLNLMNSTYGGELDHNIMAAINIEASSMVQLINVYMYTMQYVNCEQEILKLAQLQEEIEMAFTNQNIKTINCDLNQSKTTFMSLKHEPYLQKIDKMINNSFSLSTYMPNIPLAGVFMSKLLIIKGDFETASKHLEYLLHKNPCHYEALASLIDTYRRCGLLSSIPEYLEKAKLHNSQAENSSGLNYCCGVYHFYTGQSSVALTYFNRCRNDVEYAELAIYRMVEICINPDNQLLGTESVMQSNNNNNKNNSSNANDSNYNDESLSNSSIGRETAEQLLKELKIIKYKKRYRFISTFVLLATKCKTQLESALETFAQMSHEDPDSVAPIYGAAVCYIYLKQNQKARNQLKRLAKVSWNFQDAEELEKSWLLLVDMYLQSGKLEVSQDLLKKCLKYNKSSTKAYEYFGLIMEKGQNFTEASKYYEYAWNNSNHQNPVVGYKLAYNLLKSQKYVEAIEVSLQVLSAYPNYPKIQKEILDKARLNLRI